MNTSKTWIWVIIAIVVLALAIVAWQYGFLSRSITRKEAPVSDKDTTTSIGNDLNSVNVDNPNEDIKRLDADLNQL